MRIPAEDSANSGAQNAENQQLGGLCEDLRRFGVAGRQTRDSQLLDIDFTPADVLHRFERASAMEGVGRGVVCQLH